VACVDVDSVLRSIHRHLLASQPTYLSMYYLNHLLDFAPFSSGW